MICSISDLKALLCPAVLQLLIKKSSSVYMETRTFQQLGMEIAHCGVLGYKYRKTICILLLSPFLLNEDTRIYASFNVSVMFHVLLMMKSIRGPCSRDPAEPGVTHSLADRRGLHIRPRGSSPYQTAGKWQPAHKSQHAHTAHKCP